MMRQRELPNNLQFPTIASCIVDEDYHERKPHACHWKSGKALPVLTYHKRLDRLVSDVVH